VDTHIFSGYFQVPKIRDSRFEIRGHPCFILPFSSLGFIQNLSKSAVTRLATEQA
jgi:hypothetical protein